MTSAAIHLSPEGARGGAIARLKDGDRVRLDAVAGTLSYLDDLQEFDAREPKIFRPNQSAEGLGRELFASMRENAGSSSNGASFFHFTGQNS